MMWASSLEVETPRTCLILSNTSLAVSPKKFSRKTVAYQKILNN
nr:MAG TPA: hypothetical protein [Caudoviricetes sp.]